MYLLIKIIKTSLYIDLIVKKKYATINFYLKKKDLNSLYS